MSVPTVLLIYATSYGQTEKIARRAAAHLRNRGFEVLLCDARSIAPTVQVDAFDAIIVGASIIARGHQPSARAFIEANLGALNQKPSAFFSVSASAGSALETGRKAARQLRDAFLDDVRWSPAVRASIAGAINFTRYPFFLRWYMKKASRLNGGSTDTSRDHEYTDWAQVEAFAQDFASAYLEACQAPPQSSNTPQHSAGGG